MKNFILLFFFSTLFLNQSNAQNSSTEPFTVKVHITGSIRVQALQNVDLGTVISGSGITIDQNGNVVTGSVSGGTGTPGQFEVIASQGAKFEVSWTNATLKSANSLISVDFTPVMYNATNGQPVHKGDLITLQNSDRQTFVVAGATTPIPSSFSGDLTTSNPGGNPIVVTVTVISI